MNVLVAFGTRPEAIKLAPVIKELRSRPGFAVRVVTTAQHREILDQVLSVFDIVPDDDLQIMQPKQTLVDLGSRILTKMGGLLAFDRPDLVVVQGDTTSTLMCGLAAFYMGVPVAHVEAGLRTSSPTNPFPEEMNRRLTSTLSSIHFAPTERARRSLLAEGVCAEAVFVTGNPVVDALLAIRQTTRFKTETDRLAATSHGKRLLVTLHRRESWGAPLAGMCEALQRIVAIRPDVEIVFPVHPNPAVASTVHERLAGNGRISLIAPLEYVEFVALMESSWLVLTDSGGVQEEAPVLGVPVLVLRDTTERPEAVESGAACLVGTAPDTIVDMALALLDDPIRRERMARPVSPFGDGRAAGRIADILQERMS